MGYIIPGHNYCWNSYEVFLPFPFNIDLIAFMPKQMRETNIDGRGGKRYVYSWND